MWKAFGLPVPEKEFRFAPPRKWRFDFAWPAQKVAAEVEGGIWVRGRHTRGKGFLNDMEKYNEAGRLGWRVFRFSVQQYEAWELHRFIARVAEWS